MGYIAPNGVIDFYQDLGLSKGYSDTLYFPQGPANNRGFYKNAYFDSLASTNAYIGRINAQSYTRVNSGIIKVQLDGNNVMQKLHTAQYMRFKNQAFINKWYYAFIDSVEYINNITCEIRFTIDSMMTWMGTFELKECFIDRQHSTSDIIGENITDEGLDCGNYITDRTDKTGYFSQNSIAVFTAANTSEAVEAYDNLGGIPGICALYCHPIEDVDPWSETGFATWFNHNFEAGSKSREAIVSISVVPTMWANYYKYLGQDHYTPLTRLVDVSSETGLPLPALKKPESGVESFNGYVPQNNKLYTYPYMYLQVTNTEGGEAEFKYELFTDDIEYCQFKVTGIVGGQSEFRLTPLNYSGNGENGIEYDLIMSNFPQCMWGNDVYRAYLAQHATSLPVSLMSTAFSHQVRVGTGKFNQLTGNVLSTISAGNDPVKLSKIAQSAPILDVARRVNNTANLALTAVDIWNQLARIEDLKGLPPQTRGQYDVNVLAALKKKDFYFKKKRITKEYAEIIDNYFSLYGYSIRKIGTPNMNARLNWTYVKTIGCIVHGNVPSDDARNIESIFNNGIRFWNTTNGSKPTIGEYHDFYNPINN